MYLFGPMMHGDSWGWWIFATLFWLVVLFTIAYVAIKLIRSNEGGTGQRQDPVDIVKERYAKGEITKEQFEQLKKDLK